MLLCYSIVINTVNNKKKVISFDCDCTVEAQQKLFFRVTTLELEK